MTDNDNTISNPIIYTNFDEASASDVDLSPRGGINQSIDHGNDDDSPLPGHNPWKFSDKSPMATPMTVVKINEQNSEY